MATIEEVISQLLHSLRHNHISSEKLLCRTDKSDKYTIQKEKSCEDVLHLLRDPKSFWRLEDNWSDEAIRLRELLATNMDTLPDEFFYSFLKSLRVVDKGVTVVDGSVKKFAFLEDLILSGNFLEDVRPNRLPSTLLLLELNNNKISFTNGTGEALKNGVKKLKHLGLGSNGINNISWFKAKLWPNLVSLDLSKNNLTDYNETLNSVACIPCLKSLVLSGNPLSLVAGYRSGIVQTLSYLHILDDMPIAADETLNASPIENAIKAIKADNLYAVAQVQLRILTAVTGLPQPPINEVTQLPADWFYRVELIVPKSLFELEPEQTLQLPSTVFNQPPEGLGEAAANTKPTKGQGAERLPAVVEVHSNESMRICSQGLRHHPSLNLSALFQPIINTVALLQLRDAMKGSLFHVALVLIIRNVMPQEGSRPSSGKKDKHKETKDAKEGSKEAKKKAPVAEATVTTFERVTLIESPLSSGSLLSGSTTSVLLKLHVPSSNIAAVIEKLEKPRPVSASRKGGRKSPKADRNKSPKGDRQKSPANGDRKSPREKTPPPKASKQAAADKAGDKGAAGEPAPPPPPDLQASFGFDLFCVRGVSDVQKWKTVSNNTASVMALPQ